MPKNDRKPTQIRVPRIVPPKHPDVPHPTEGEEEDAKEDYQFFAYPTAQRKEYLKKRIKEREEALFELQCNQAMLEGTPAPGEHLSEAERTVETAGGLTHIRPCACAACELKRLNTAIVGLEFGLMKLRALVN